MTSAAAEASIAPSGEKARERIGLVCPERVAITWPPAISNTWTSLPDPEARIAPSGEMVTALAPPDREVVVTACVSRSHSLTPSSEPEASVVPPGAKATE